MDTYLKIALDILRRERRPMSSRSILATAYKRGLVPTHLYGRTQHKTLQARLSEDIVNYRDRSQFFRTAPGKFFIRELLRDERLPESFRRPIPTRRRKRELERGLALSLKVHDLEAAAEKSAVIEPSVVLDLLRLAQYEDCRSADPNTIFLRSFVCVRRGDTFLSYRVGRYRDDRDAFLHRRSIGFSTLVQDDECTLFTREDCGIVDAGVNAAALDLDIPETPEPLNSSLSHFVWPRDSSDSTFLFAVVFFECPSWFEPTKRRLALNDLDWLDLCRWNDLDDFDPWSREVVKSLSQVIGSLSGPQVSGQSNC